MTKKELLDNIKEALQREDELMGDEKIEDIEEWDSLGLISVISLFNDLFPQENLSKQIQEAKSLQDIINLAQKHLNG